MKNNINEYLIISILIIGVIPISVFAAPGIPHQFYGNATYTNGVAISSGNVIVKIGVIQVATVPINNGEYGYNPNLLFVTDPDSNRAGSPLMFFIGNVDTGRTAVFANGGYTNLNLDTIVAPTPTPTPTSTPTPTPTPALGGGGGTNPLPSSTINPTPTLTTTPAPKIVLTEEQKKVDANNDGMIDVLDFNTLMVNWGDAGGMGDFDGNGTVDVFDFNMLMINWS